jgi:hypothetical protein
MAHDRAWLQLLDQDGNVVAAVSMGPPRDARAETIKGGYIVIHTKKK